MTQMAHMAEIGVLLLLAAPLAVQVISPLRRRSYLSRFLWRSGDRIHLGTSYDLLWRMPKRNRRAVLREIRAGLAALPRGRYTVCAWFLTPRPGFVEEPATLWDKLDLAGGYVEILFQQWLITGRVRFFNPFRVRRYRFQAA